jgi:regulator of protease activity HflC (stomatin/prohibitin superfamily)
MSRVRLLCLAPLALLVVGCNQAVPTGHVGKVRTVSGFDATVLRPGLHPCWGRDVMHALEVSDQQFNLNMSVLCKDQLNFKFDVGVLCAVDKTKTDLINQTFENVTPANGNTITMQQLFTMYVQPVVDQEARKVVSSYATKDIAERREEVIESIRTAINEAISTSLMVVKRITVNNLDFPDVITRAQEERARRQVEIAGVQADVDKKLAEARGQLAVAQLDYERQLIEAAMIADSNQIIGASISPQYLAWWELKVLSSAASGPNNWGFIPYTDLKASAIGDPSQWVQTAIDAELRDRLQVIRNRVTEGVKPPADIEGGGEGGD